MFRVWLLIPVTSWPAPCRGRIVGVDEDANEDATLAPDGLLKSGVLLLFV